MRLKFNPARHVKMAVSIVLLVFSTAAMAQTITLPAQKTTRLEAIQQVEKQTEYRFTYNKENFAEERSIDFGATEVDFARVLDKIVENSGYKYAIDGKNVIIVPAPAPDVAARSVIRGMVTDKSNRTPLAGVSVEVVGTDHIYNTSPTGRFRTGVLPAGSYVLKFSYQPLGLMKYIMVNVGEGAEANIRVSLTEGGEPAKTAPYLISMAELMDYNTQQLPSTYFVREQYDGNKMEYISVPRNSVYRDYDQKLAIKTNLLWWITLSPNFAAEFAFNKKWTLDASVVYNTWKFDDYESRSFWLVQPELRYWFCRSFERHFVGLHLIYGEYCLGQVSLPLLDSMKDYIYDGYGYGAGISYGYHLPLGRRWGAEFTVGAGWVHLDYDQYKCITCSQYEGHQVKNYFGPTKLGVSFAYMIR